MREIKFRVWEFLHEKMHYLKNRDFAWLGETALNSKYYEVMQFTGLKDKYGKEIYERDILIDNSGEKFLVMYYDIRSGYYLQVLRTEMMNDIDLFEMDLMVVYGNDFENKELLNSVEIKK